jgi:hypothetical protein
VALPSHPDFIAVKATSAAAVSGDEVSSKSVSFDMKTDVLDITDFKDTTGCKIKLAGLRDGSASLDGDWDYSTAPQALLYSSWATGVSIWLTAHYAPSASAGSKGFNVECLVESLSIKGEVAGTNTFSASLTFKAAPTLV